MGETNYQTVIGRDICMCIRKVGRFDFGISRMCCIFSWFDVFVAERSMATRRRQRRSTLWMKRFKIEFKYMMYVFSYSNKFINTVEIWHIAHRALFRDCFTTIRSDGTVCRYIYKLTIRMFCLHAMDWLFIWICDRLLKFADIWLKKNTRNKCSY